MKHLELDVNQFWADDALSHQDNCFSTDAPQVALGIRMSNECVYAELGVEGHPWDPIDPIRQAELNKRYNDKAEKIVGKRLLQEHFDTVHFPYVKRIGEIFGSRYEYINHSEWYCKRCKLFHRINRTICSNNAVSITGYSLCKCTYQRLAL